ncbi:hypothetical protein LX15_003331 [Streptoalloteichus tenebrarius]|uniref:Uncharacterized protein n=1 Tax=Streptoalloteichus tenebrarius (strain ATCC 17920 / DSM 40477 / JCM 4838 / CBS 697.72 / NBRC 16177 / NCIMB 11028 / NRRL B-12390 / A12253. 1 / ISP 5477) TaxID=1933 RepID=A0ABT1HVV5_STRSD|nr:hypothetical protein [Streptoalloteichus tenebrarius]MCP2259626.1 hypothetical protein [Streptoalloteichus tenebrarius]BFF00968.1 hypothetical protein GCM10020241_26430 [Streptoalloteichus tenebrarius]
MLALQHAAFALGWRGVVIADVAVLGQRVSAVVRVRKDVHRWRVRNGWPPETDPNWFRSWFDPTFHDRLPVPAVDLVGVLVEETALSRALESCGTLMTLAPCAVVLPTPQDDEWPLIELDYYGVGVVTTLADGNSAVSVLPEDRSREFGPSLFGRWLLEVLYDRVLKAEVARAQARR